MRKADHCRRHLEYLSGFGEDGSRNLPIVIRSDGGRSPCCDDSWPEHPEAWVMSTGATHFLPIVRPRNFSADRKLTDRAATEDALGRKQLLLQWVMHSCSGGGEKRYAGRAKESGCKSSMPKSPTIRKHFESVHGSKRGNIFEHDLGAYLDEMGISRNLHEVYGQGASRRPYPMNIDELFDLNLVTGRLHASNLTEIRVLVRHQPAIASGGETDPYLIRTA